MHDAHQRHWYTTCLLLGGAVPAAAKLSLQREDAQKRRSLAELRFFVREAVAGFTNRPNLLRLTDQPGKELGGLGAFASALVGCAGRVGHREGPGGQPARPAPPLHSRSDRSVVCMRSAVASSTSLELRRRMTPLCLLIGGDFRNHFIPIEEVRCGLLTDALIGCPARPAERCNHACANASQGSAGWPGVRCLRQRCAGNHSATAPLPHPAQ